MEYGGIGMLLLGLSWVAGFGYAHFRAVGKAKAAETWPTAVRRVISCEVVEEESGDRDGAASTWYNRDFLAVEPRLRICRPRRSLGGTVISSRSASGR